MYLHAQSLMKCFPLFCPGGDIVVKLGRSDYFEADTRASEDPSLEKVEANYKGGEFEMQFACRFKGSNKPKEKEIFGKVFVRRRKEDGSEERLFEFNLIKVNYPSKVLNLIKNNVMFLPMIQILLSIQVLMT